MKKQGTEYELFVQKIMQAIVDAEPIAQQKNITIKHNIKLTNARTGRKRQFDIYWEYQLAGITYKTIIECKDYNKLIPVSKIDEIIGKLQDFPEIKPIIATQKGFQAGAIETAKAHNVELIVVRDEDIEKDWTGSDGKPLLRTIRIDLHFLMPIHVTRFQPVVDRTWAKANNKKTIHINAKNCDIYINNITKGERISLYDYENQIPRNETIKEIKKTVREDFDNAFLETPDTKVKIKAFEMDYIAPPQEVRQIEISPEVAGVVEYLNTARKKIVMNKGGRTVVKDCEG